MKFKILSQQSITNNTAEFGFGDYRETKLSLSAIIDSETEKKQSQYLKKNLTNLQNSTDIHLHTLSFQNLIIVETNQIFTKNINKLKTNKN